MNAFDWSQEDPKEMLRQAQEAEALKNLSKMFSNNGDGLNKNVLSSLQSVTDRPAMRSINMPDDNMSGQVERPSLEYKPPLPPSMHPEPQPKPEEPLPQMPQPDYSNLQQLFRNYEQGAMAAPAKNAQLEGMARGLMHKQAQNQMSPEQMRELYEKAQRIRQGGTAASEQSHKFYWYPQYGGTEETAVSPEVVQRNAVDEAEMALGPLKANQAYNQQVQGNMSNINTVSNMEERGLLNKANELQTYANATKLKEGFETEAAKRDPNSPISRIYVDNVKKELLNQADLMERASRYEPNRPYKELTGFNRNLADKLKGMSYIQAEGILKASGGAFDQIDKMAKDMTQQEHNRATEALAGANLRARQQEQNKATPEEMKLLEEVQTASANIDQLQRIADIKSKVSTGHVREFISDADNWLPIAKAFGLEDQVRDFNGLKTEVANLFNATQHSIGGSALSPQEWKNIEPQIPGGGDSDERFIDKISKLMPILRGILGRKIEKYQAYKRSADFDLSPHLAKAGSKEPAIKPRIVIKKQYSPSRDQTKITYSDGKEEFVNGQR